jgi:hypothetical protein
MNMMFNDAQAGLGFVVSQTAHIETQVYQVKFTQIQYPDLIPCDFSANPWAKTVAFYSSEQFGTAAWLSDASDIPYGSDERAKFETSVWSAARGYRYSLEEVNQAAMLGQSLESDRAIGARRAYEEFVDALALTGDTKKGMKGLFNHASVPQVALPNGASASPLWANKTPAEKLADANSLLTGVQTATSNVALADTLLLPYTRFNAIASEQLPNQSMTTLEFLRKFNVYTATTGKPLTIRGLIGLDTAGSGGTARSIAYRRDPEVLKMHIPMPLRFMPVQVVGLDYRVPGMFRVGGLDIRLPKEVRYGDGL